MEVNGYGIALFIMVNECFFDKRKSEERKEGTMVAFQMGARL